LSPTCLLQVACYPCALSVPFFKFPLCSPFLVLCTLLARLAVSAA
jgi:hypothetical protein